MKKLFALALVTAATVGSSVFARHYRYSYDNCCPRTTACYDACDTCEDTCTSCGSCSR